MIQKINKVNYHCGGREAISKMPIIKKMENSIALGIILFCHFQWILAASHDGHLHSINKTPGTYKYVDAFESYKSEYDGLCFGCLNANFYYCISTERCVLRPEDCILNNKTNNDEIFPGIFVTRDQGCPVKERCQIGLKGVGFIVIEEYLDYYF